MTRAQRKKLKLQEDNMISYVKDALKRKIEELDGQGKLPKLFTMCSIVKEQSREQLGFLNGSLVDNNTYCRGSVEATKSSIEGPVPTVAGRLLPAPSLDDSNLPCAVLHYR
ncbi:hypothetical protein M9H77_18885 [Catharanthus roseus]|uniref:Uncharacterized protein n=1 Tax=Catharanthus roseus TaxID=4058 RepID=A0ACC0B8N6_CATRO|nr:hypothetical protein M9H77_18885 [Catharanthus roseus]